MLSANHRTAVITMVRATEFPAAWSSLETIAPQLGENTQHFVLLNDARHEKIERRIAQRPYTRLITPGENLGVARGRNRLLEAAREWGATLFVSLDDDLLVPSDFVERITTWIVERSANGEKVGVVTPAVLDFAGISVALGDEKWRTNAVSGQVGVFESTESLRTRLNASLSQQLPPELVYHAGIRDWRRHYLDSYQGIASTAFEIYLNSRGRRLEDGAPTEARNDDEVLQAVLNGTTEPVAIDTAPGGACAFTLSLIDEIGLIDEAFSPFGYEDSDFAVRSMTAGFHNYLLPAEFVVHDIEGRQTARPTTILLHSQGRARALFALKHLTDADRVRALAEIITLAPLQAIALTEIFGSPAKSRLGNALGAMTSYLSGIVDGLFAQSEQQIPGRMDKRVRFNHQFWRGSPANGLPQSLPLDIELVYSWDDEASRFLLQNLAVDSPGAFRLRLSGDIRNVRARDDAGNPDPGQAELAGLNLEIEDWGFIRRLETSVAWFRRSTSSGYLASLARSIAGRGPATRFVGLRSEPATYLLSLQPENPITVADLFAHTPGINLTRRLGIRSMVNHLARY